MLSPRLKCAPVLLLAAAFGLGAVALSPGTAAAQDKDKSDLDRLQGEWEVVSGKKGNEDIPEEFLKSVKLKFTGEKLAFQIGDDTKEGTFKIDPKQNPKHIDLTIDGKTVKGLYAFDGERVKLVAGEPEQDRPAKLEPAENFNFVVLKRVGGGKQPRPQPQARRAAAVQLTAAPARGDKSDLEFFQGDWEVVSAEKDGIKFPEEATKTVKLSVMGEKASMELIGESKKGTFKIDPKQDPRHIDLEFDKMTVLGIYKIEKDGFTVCMADPGQPRPKDFKAASSTLIVWRRAKASDKKEEKKKAEVEKDGVRSRSAAPQEGALRTQSANKLKAIGLAMHAYHDAHRAFPAHAIYSKDGKPLLSWRVAILPYLDQKALYNEFKLDEPWDSEHNKKLIARMPKVFEIPGGGEEYTTLYQVFTGPGTIFDGKDGVRITGISDGTSNTALAVEGGKAVIWTQPEDVPADKGRDLPKLGGLFKAGFHLLMADGSVRFVNADISADVLRAFISRNGGEVLPNN